MCHRKVVKSGWNGPHQIFILAAVFGGACVLLILAVIALAVCVLKWAPSKRSLLWSWLLSHIMLPAWWHETVNVLALDYKWPWQWYCFSALTIERLGRWDNKRNQITWAFGKEIFGLDPRINYFLALGSLWPFRPPNPSRRRACGLSGAFSQNVYRL